MAMSVELGGQQIKMMDINTTPLVDVMLVLLIIFLLTVTVAVQAIPLKLPDVVFDPTITKPENVSLSVTTAPDGSCAVYWNQSKVGHQELLDKAVGKLKADVARLKAAGPINPDDLPEAHIRGDVNAPYKCIGGTVYTMQMAGFSKVGFISQPPPHGG